MANKPDDIIERTSIVSYTLMNELHAALSDPDAANDDVTLGMIMGLAMFLDEKVGPIRAQRLLAATPGIVLKTDAHVNERMARQFSPVLKAFGELLVQNHAEASA